MAEEFGSSDFQTEAPKKKSNTLLIVVVVLIVLCCCCVVLGGGGWWLWNNGDSLFDITKAILTLTL